MLCWSLLLAMLLSALLVLALRWINPPTSGIAISRVLQARLEGRPPPRAWQCWQPLARMGTALPMAVIAAEDQRFSEHSGFDLVQLRIALEQAGDGKRLRGASTISQQTAKNLFLWPGRSWLRKGLELWFTGLIELSWPKQRILEVYLNIVEFGDGIYGACAGARQHFQLEPSALSPLQAAQLAATLPNPRSHRANPPSPYVQARARWILGQIQNLGADAYLQELGVAAGSPTDSGKR